MKKQTIKLALLITLSLSATAYAGGVAGENLTDVSYQFDQTKLNAALDSFHFLRSYVDYYYDLIPANLKALNVAQSASRFSGWCVGDAHPENFGTLLQNNGTAIFSMNDMDDAGACPVVYDFLRLLVSSRLYQPNFNIASMISSYEQGLNLENVNVPAKIQTMLVQGKKSGESINPKELDGNRFKRKKDSSEVPADIRSNIESNLQKLFAGNDFLSENIKVVDVLSTSKAGGGSGGLLRYEILCSRANGDYLHLELKELTTPGIASVATESIPDQKTRMLKSARIEQGDNFSRFYNVFVINGKTMLLRPKFSGNIGISLGNLLSAEESNQVINYEAFVLGRIHAQSVDVTMYRKALDQLKANDWENDVSAFTKQFNKKFSQLKN